MLREERCQLEVFPLVEAKAQDTLIHPSFFIFFVVGLGIWWGLPELVGVLRASLLLFSVSQALNAIETAHAAKNNHNRFPARFSIFAAFALLYGVCETMNGNWAAPYMTKHFGASASMASLA